MYCEHCHAEISPSHTSCPVCKHPVKAVHSICPNCSSDIGVDNICCQKCGYHLLLKKVIKLHDMPGAPPPQTTIICHACKREIPIASRFCEHCGADVRANAPASATPAHTATAQEKTTKPEENAPKQCLGFNEPTFIALIKALEKKGVISIDDLQSHIGR